MTAPIHTPRRALLVIDVQQEYFNGKLSISHPPVSVSLPNILKAMNAAKASGIPIVVVQHVFPAGFPVFAEGSQGVALHPEIEAFPRDLLVQKSKASALHETGLQDWLRTKAIETLSIVGYMTHNCDDATARHAYHEGWKVELLMDASGSLPYANAAGSATAEEIHRVFSVVMHTGFAAVATTAEWIKALQVGEPLVPDNVYLSYQRALLQKIEASATSQTVQE